MHDTARLTGEAFFKVYGCTSGLIVDVGSMDVNGTLRPYAPAGMTYVGLDAVGGPGVDIVLEDPYKFPADDGWANLVVSTSCLEHADYFWLTFAEMARILAPGGFLYVSAPTGGVVHRHPVDNWRFYPDAGLALAGWAQRSGYALALVESFILPPRADHWSDFVAVFEKLSESVSQRRSRIVDTFPEALHRRP